MRLDLCSLAFALVAVQAVPLNRGFHQHLDFVVSVDDSPPDISKVGYEKVMVWAKQRTASAENDWKERRKTSPESWGTEIVYSVMPDRFANGNVTNDFVNIPADQARFGKSSLHGLPSYRHGGDLQGIINRLDYIADLGATTLWITPVLMNAGGEYHAYCTSDMTAMDPGFGSWDDYRRLVSEAHRRGMYVVQDIVINHFCSPDTGYLRRPPDHESCASRLDSQFWSGPPVGDAGAEGALNFSASFFGPLRSDFFFNRCGANSGGDTSSAGPAAIYGDFVESMLDLATYNYDLQDLFTELVKPLIGAADIDGLRLDAAKHVTEDFIAHLSTKTREYARSLGKHNFLVVGEVAAPADWIGRRLGDMFADPRDPKARHGTVPVSLLDKLDVLRGAYLADNVAPYPGLGAAYEFAASGTARDALLGTRVSSDVAAYYDSPDYRTVSGQGTDPRIAWTLLDIHDWPRFLVKQPGNMELASAAAAYLLTTQGTPIIWMGYEQGFNQDCDSVPNWDARDAEGEIRATCRDGGDDVLKRQDMFVGGPWRLGSAVPSIRALGYVGAWEPKETTADWKSDPFLDRSHALYKNVRKLARVRRSCTPLSLGALVWRNAESEAGGLLVFSRVLDTRAEVVVLVNPGWNWKSVAAIPLDASVNFHADFQKYVDVFDESNARTASVGYPDGDPAKGPHLYLPDGYRMPPRSFAVYVHSNNAGPWDAALEARLCKPLQEYF